MEWVTVYNEDREMIRTQERGKALAPGEYLVAVGIWVVDSQKRLLVTKRSPVKKFAPGLWENTGGHLQSGETPVQAVLRELWEETGITAQPEDTVFLGSVKSGPYFGDNYCVRMDFPVEQVRLQPGETCDAKWITWAEFQEMAARGEFAPSVLSHLEQYKENFYKVLEGNPHCTPSSSLA